jgi:hypothetical protein
MSTPSLPSYMGSWEELIELLLNNPFLGSGSGILPSTRVDPALMSSHGRALPGGAASSPIPVPWRSALSALLGAISLREVANAMPEGYVKSEMNQRVDQTIADVIDDWCGTPPRLIPWPWPGPPPWAYPIATSLAAMANTLQEGSMRTELLELAGRVVQKSFGLAGREVKNLTPEEVDALAAFPSNESECEDLCRDRLAALDKLPEATGKSRRLLLARLRAIDARRKALRCTDICVPQ